MSADRSDRAARGKQQCDPRAVLCYAGYMQPVHTVLDYDLTSSTVKCARCGTVPLVWKSGRPKCAVARKEQRGSPSRPSRNKQWKHLDRAMLSKARRRAKMRGLEFDLTLADVVIPPVCPILGIPLHRVDGKPGDNSPTIDRRDNSRGYTKDNIQIISHRANRIKSDATKEELLAIAASM